MKTTNTLRNLNKAMMILGTLAILNIGTAQTSFLSAGNLMSPDNEIITGNVPEKATVLPSNPAMNTIIDEMNQNPEYWVDYLKNSISEESEEISLSEEFESPVLNQMDNDPGYWMHYLENATILDNSINDLPSILDTMESDPYYWPHYLQNTVETDTI
ncbi:MAG: hypothetical protein AB9842_12480 [Bacteroidales bacterium]